MGPPPLFTLTYNVFMLRCYSTQLNKTVACMVLSEPSACSAQQGHTERTERVARYFNWVQPIRCALFALHTSYQLIEKL